MGLFIEIMLWVIIIAAGISAVALVLSIPIKIGQSAADAAARRKAKRGPGKS